MHLVRRPHFKIAALLCCVLALWTGRHAIARSFMARSHSNSESTRQLRTFKSAVERTEHHYGKSIDRLAAEFDLPPAYLKALVVLECSGRGEVPSRFEPHVYKKLVDLRSGKKRRYGGLKHKDVKDANDAALKNLARSWGPFQLMGYQCVAMDLRVHDIRGDSALYWGMKWIDKAYGKKLRKEKFRDAFHIHNTGRPFPLNGRPRTHDPKYCDRGLAYIKRFSSTQQG